ncbi:unnamed protein product [Urochloa humidicola]
MCYVLAPGYSLRISSAHGEGKRSIVRSSRPPLHLRVSSWRHGYVPRDKLKASYAVERIGDNKRECIDVSIQQMGRHGGLKSNQLFLTSSDGDGVRDRVG